MILIAGAGIGGLTLGCALARAGRRFRISERAAELRPVGAGIALSDNAFRALACIGLADAVRACGQELRLAAICEPSGRVITEMTPNMGMGGCQAIEDAVVLSDALAHEPDIDSALACYQRRRMARANGFVVRSFRLGRIAQLRSRPLRWLRDRAMAAVPVRLAARAMARDMDFRL